MTVRRTGREWHANWYGNSEGMDRTVFLRRFAKGKKLLKSWKNYFLIITFFLAFTDVWIDADPYSRVFFICFNDKHIKNSFIDFEYKYKNICTIPTLSTSIRSRFTLKNLKEDVFLRFSLWQIRIYVYMFDEENGARFHMATCNYARVDKSAEVYLTYFKSDPRTLPEVDSTLWEIIIFQYSILQLLQMSKFLIPFLISLMQML